MNKVEINIPDLLKLTESQSINSIAKQYGYSYATLYRRVEELKKEKSESDRVEQEFIKKVRPLKKSSIQVINSVTFRYLNIDIQDNTDIQEELFILANNEELIELNNYEFNFSKSGDRFDKEMRIDCEVYEKIEKIENLMICNRIKEYTNGAYFTDDKDIFYATISEDLDIEKEIFISFNKKIADITSLYSNSYRGALHKSGNVFTIGRVFKVSTENMRRLRESFLITHRLHNIHETNYPIVKNK